MSVVTRIRTSEELTVPFTREDVWPVLADVAAYPEWWPASLRVEVLAEREGILGSEIEVRPVMGRMFRIRIEEVEEIHSLRLRFFGGSLEGPGGFHLRSVDGATHVRYEMDVFARGLGVALLSQLTPLHLIHSSRMRGVLRNLASRLKRLRKAADAETSRAARTRAQEEAVARAAVMEAARRTAEAARRGAEEEGAARVAAEEAERRAAEEAARRAAEEEARKKAVQDTRKQAEEEAAARVAAEEAERRAAEEAERRAAEESARRRTDEDAARRMADQVMARAAADEASEGPDVRAAKLPHDSIGSRIRAALGRIGEWFREPPGPTPPLTPRTDAVAPSPSIFPDSNFEAARRYIDALSSTATPEEIGAYFVTTASQEEFPHRFLRTSLTRGLPEIIEARARTLTVFKSQRYDLTGATGGGSQVAMEVRFQGTVGSTGDGFVEGEDLEARLAIFLKFAEGRILRQRSYACFEPWSTQAERRVILDERLALAGQFVPAAPKGLGAAAPQGSTFDRARSYLDALNARADAETISSFFAPDAVQEELPNRLTPAGAWRDLEAIKRARIRGLKTTSFEQYELMGATGGGSQVALELHWTATAAGGGADPEPGRRLEARVAMFLTFRDGLIVRQRNYNCV